MNKYTAKWWRSFGVAYSALANNGWPVKDKGVQKWINNQKFRYRSTLRGDRRTPLNEKQVAALIKMPGWVEHTPVIPASNVVQTYSGTLNQLLVEIKFHEQTRGRKTADSLQNQVMYLRRIEDELGATPVKTLTPVFIRDELRKWRTKTSPTRLLSQSTRLHYYGILREVFDVAYWMNHVPFNPVSAIPTEEFKPTGPADFRPITRAELDKFLGLMPDVMDGYKALYEFFFITGATISEAGGLRWDDVAKNLKSCTLTNFEGSRRDVPAELAFLSEARSQFPDSILVFEHLKFYLDPNRKGYSLSSNIRKRCYEINSTLSRPITPVLLRRSCTFYLLQCFSEAEVRKMMGFKSHMTTEQYARDPLSLKTAATRKRIAQEVEASA